jgi:hypothetical protein
LSISLSKDGSGRLKASKIKKVGDFYKSSTFDVQVVTTG